MIENLYKKFFSQIFHNIFEKDEKIKLSTIITQDYLTVVLFSQAGETKGIIKGVLFDDSVKIIACVCDGSYASFKRLMHRFIHEAKRLSAYVIELHMSALDETTRHYIDKYGFERPYGDETYLEWRVR